MFQMFQRRLVPGLVLWLMAQAVLADHPAPDSAAPSASLVTNLVELRQLVNRQKTATRSLNLEGTVTLTAPRRGILLQDDTGAEWLALKQDGRFLKSGQRILISGNCRVVRSDLGISFASTNSAPAGSDSETRSGERSKSFGIQVLNAEHWPRPLPLNGGQPLSAKDENRWAQIEATVAEAGERGGELRLELMSPASPLTATVAGNFPGLAELLLNSTIRLEGVAQSVLDSQGNRKMGWLTVPSPLQLTLLQLPENVWQRYPTNSIEAELVFAATNSTITIVHLRGKVSANESGNSWQLDDGTGQAELHGNGAESLPHDQPVEILGMAYGQNGKLIVEGAASRYLRRAEGSPRKLPVLTSIEEVRHLSPSEASKAYPVRLKGVITYGPGEGWGNINSGAIGINVASIGAGNPQSPEVGDYCEIEGVTKRFGFGPSIECTKRTVLGRALLPQPLRRSLVELLNGSLDGQWVEVQGVVLSQESNAVTTTFVLGLPSGRLIFCIPQSLQPWSQIPSFMDALVQIRGVVMPSFNERQQIETTRIFLPSSEFITVNDRPPKDLFSETSKHVFELRLFQPDAAVLRRVKVTGQIIFCGRETYYVMDGQDGLKFIPRAPMKLDPGDLVEVVGYYPSGSGIGAPVLGGAMVRRVGFTNLPPARMLTATNLFRAGNDSTLVSVDGRLVSIGVSFGEQEIEFQAGPHLGTARLSGRLATSPPIGSLLRLTGVYAGQGGDPAVSQTFDSFDLLVNSPHDIQILARPSWWTIQHTLMVIGALVAIMVLSAVWIVVLRRQVEERSAQLASEIENRKLIEQEHLLEQERTRVAQDLHDELGAGLTEMGLLGALMQNPAIPAEKKAGYLNQMINMARGLVTALDEIVWAVNPHYNSVAALRGYCILYAQRFLDLVAIRCFTDLDEDFPEYPLNSNTRHSLFLAFKEALTNVVRHSQATEARLRIRVENGVLVIEITDNGRGLDLTTASPGMDGIRNMQDRLQRFGGECHIESKPDQGTTVRFRLPLNNVGLVPNQN